MDDWQHDKSTGSLSRAIKSLARSLHWLLAVLRKFRLNTVQLLGRGFFLMLSAVSRALRYSPSRQQLPGPSQDAKSSDSKGTASPDISSGRGALATSIPSDDAHLQNFASASLLPMFRENSSRHSDSRASRSTPDLSPRAVARGSDPICRWSGQEFPATISFKYPPTPQSILPPNPALGALSPSAANPDVDNTERENEGMPPLLTKSHPHIFPGTPESVQRYDRKASIPDEPSQWTIPPLSVSFLPVPPPPLGWIACVHPEGAPYFFHEEKRAFTDAYLFDNATLEFINANMLLIDEFLLTHNIQLPLGVDLVLEEHTRPDKSHGCLYYFVNHSDRTVFWLDVAASEMFSIMANLNGVSSPSHIQLELEAQYWCATLCLYASWMFTVIKVQLRTISQGVGSDARNTRRPPRHGVLCARRCGLHFRMEIFLTIFSSDVITSTTSTVTWKLDELDRILHLTDSLAKTIGNPKFSSSSCRNVGRFMYRFLRQRVHDFHGQLGARLDIDQWVYSTTPKRTTVFELLNFLLFSAPNWNLLGVRMLYTHGLVPPSTWATFIAQLESEWQEFTLYATVVLTANVAFLAIQSVDNDSENGPYRSPPQILSYLSILTSIGGIIIRMLLLITQHGNWESKWGPHTFAFLIRQYRLEALAIAYALPYGMLLWSMLWFLAAFSSLCFEKSGTATRAVVAILWLSVAILVLWCNYGNTRGFRWLNMRLARRARGTRE
ncbi:hypothetical protein B0H16DRAFT_1683922 [Mycena metata]|uniref:Uncharacterized protein n=1 Tax=Mycena metata TaxID=1033252 RepID=A0AAD7K3B4_9AGAR|nr:hypothetical protein B0H16DRAFT_1683922 [Mycena metata]